MRESYLFDEMDKRWTRLLKLVENVPADKRSMVPQGFNNNVLWHLGHILVTTDRIFYTFSGQSPKLPEEYQTYFKTGTRPAEWVGEPPAWDDVIAKLEQQPVQIRTEFTGRTNQPVSENFFKAETVDELLLSLIAHTTSHAANVAYMLRILG